MFADYAKIFIKAGDGGDGCVSFYTEKYVSDGGPDGGDGGRGGDVYFTARSNISSLLSFKYSRKYAAGDGAKGQPKHCHGKGGKDLVIDVPLGTVVRDAQTKAVIADLFYDGDTVKVLSGGAGGKGNARFKTSRRQAPQFAQKGRKAIQAEVILELKLIADVGLIGFPNVGKSTLLSVISAARPKIADYHFTTLEPNLGVVSYHGNTFAVADIPGLIEGASRGAGLGHAFLRHIDRTRMLVHVVDISGIEGRDPYNDYLTVNNELESYSIALAGLPQIIALNKSDIVASKKTVDAFIKKVNAPVVLISAATRSGIDELIKAVYEKLSTLPRPAPMEFEPFVYAAPDAGEYNVQRVSQGFYEVSGGFVEELARNVVLDDYNSLVFLQKKLKEQGVIKDLLKAGLKDGDTVKILDIEFEFTE